MTLKTLSADEHYGTIGFGQMTLRANDAFSALQLDTVIEPTFVIKELAGRRVLEIDVEQVLAWDVKQWYVRANIVPLNVNSGDTIPRAVGGITKDNTGDGEDQPTIDSVAQGVLPGGSRPAVVGINTGGGEDAATTGGQTAPRYVIDWEYFNAADEEQTAVGQILWNLAQKPRTNLINSMYMVDGHSVHKLLTARHYHQWFDTDGLAAAPFQSIGAEVRRMSLDFNEIVFDREVILSILDTLVVLN